MAGYYQTTNPYNQWYQAPVMPAVSQVPQQNNNSVMVVFVEGEAGARSYPVAAGNTVMLMDFNSNKFWLKATDTNGMPQQLRTFEFKEQVTPQQNQNGTQQIVTREEFNSLSEKLDKLISELGGSK